MRNTLVRVAAAALVAAPLALFAPAVASASVVYDAIPSTLAPNYPSQPFQAQQTNEFGDYVHLGGADRLLTTVDVTMSDWARASEPDNQTFCAASPSNCDSTGFFWPITVNVYSSHLGANGVPDTLLATKTVTQHILWRPEGDQSCPDTGYGAGFAWKASDQNCYNGYAFTISFDLSSLHVTLPNDVIVGFVYNTQTYGPNPTGVNGPYNSLNIAVPPSDPVTAGTDDSNDQVFWNTNTAGWYADHGAAGVGILRKDTNWAPYGTVAMQIQAVVPPKVVIAKYVDGAHATAANANSAVFPMITSWVSSGVNGTQNNVPFTLSPQPWGGIGDPYEATYINGQVGDNYSTNEVTTGNQVVADTCSGTPFALAGYTTGNSWSEAQQATPSLTIPAFTNLQNDKYVIVWNKTCPVPPPANACATPDHAPQGWTLRSGTTKSDTVILTPFTMFVGNGGNDTVVAGDGNYIVCTGAGNDTIKVGTGTSVIDAGNGNNTVKTGDGDQRVTTGSGNDTVATGSGNDAIDVGNGNNAVSSGAGNDTITAGSGNDAVSAGAGTDTCSLGGGHNFKSGCEL